jgi:hypothetical protein
LRSAAAPDEPAATGERSRTESGITRRCGAFPAEGESGLAKWAYSTKETQNVSQQLERILPKVHAQTKKYMLKQKEQERGDDSKKIVPV